MKEVKINSFVLFFTLYQLGHVLDPLTKLNFNLCEMHRKALKTAITLNCVVQTVAFFRVRIKV